jgi:hypothetical protein
MEGQTDMQENERISERHQRMISKTFANALHQQRPEIMAAAAMQQPATIYFDAGVRTVKSISDLAGAFLDSLHMSDMFHVQSNEVERNNTYRKFVSDLANQGLKVSGIQTGTEYVSGARYPYVSLSIAAK